MSRRTIKKLLRRAEDAFRNECYAEDEGIYRSMLDRFQQSPPWLLDHAACLYGLIQTLHFSGQSERAQHLAAQAVEILTAHAKMEVAA
jgi:type VI protein secretion system component VasF